jgi:prolyl-tRNA synthetase
MRYSQLFTKTTKDIPSDETSKNAQLLIRAGFVHKTMAGVYALLPLGLRVLNKIEQIIREEMIAIGSQEILLNALNPKKLWTDTNRWDNVDILFKIKSQIDSDYALACTHEEQVTPLVKSYVNSWKDIPICDGKSTFPLSVFQIQTKFRDELRAKSGLLRGREFRMKDMYDFHQTQESLDSYYELVKIAYAKAYKRMGLEVYATEASGGIFTTNPSHEFQAVCSAGEDKIYKVPSTGVFFNEEMAPVQAKPWSNMDEPEKPRQDILAEGVIGTDEVAKHVGIDVEQTTKTLFYETVEGKMIAACVRGKYKINEEKLAKICGKHIKLASAELVMKITGAEIGYAGLVDLPNYVEVYVDESCANRKNFEMGTNKTGYHSINLNFGRDIPIPHQFYDIKVIESGDCYPETGEKYEVFVSAEVGNIFKLGTKYTDSVDFNFVTKDNTLQRVIMGCHGIGTTRCMAVIAETYNDENGLKWPESLAPFRYEIVTNINSKDDTDTIDKITAIAEGLYEGQLKVVTSGESFRLVNTTDWSDIGSFMLDDTMESITKEHEEMLWDDRENTSMGEKLKDADLIGCNYQIIISKKTLEKGCVELKVRATGEILNIAIS